MDAPTGPSPVLSIVAGNPTPEQVAALVTVLFGVTAPAGAAGPGPVMRSEWASKSRPLRLPLHRGPGTWRASARPW